MRLSIVTRSINIIEIDSFEQFLIPSIEELTASGLWVSMTGTFPIGIDFRVNKVMSVHELNFAVFQRSAFKTNSWIAQQNTLDVDWFVFGLIVIVVDL